LVHWDAGLEAELFGCHFAPTLVGAADGIDGAALGVGLARRKGTAQQADGDPSLESHFHRPLLKWKSKPFVRA
jgi:hypothetical protein